MAAIANAQSGRHGGGGRAAGGVHRGTHRGDVRIIGPGHDHGRHDRGWPSGGFISPFWYGGYYDEPVVIEREVPVLPAAPPPPQFVPLEPQRIPTPPKMTEIPAATKTQASKPQAAAVFILSSGERIEARRYLLTADGVQLTINRKLRSIPLESLDVPATAAANRERGLDLRLPEGGSEVLLGF